MGLQAGCCELQRDAHFDPLRLPLLAGLSTQKLNNDGNVPVVYSYVMYDISWAYFILDRKCKVQLLQKKKGVVSIQAS